jgi:ribosomal protein S18 acetylase RimI-like enzyme
MGWHTSNMHPLDNAIWQALTTRQTEFAERSGAASRFMPEVTLLAGFEHPDDDGYASLAGLVESGETAAVFLENPFEERDGWSYVVGAPLLQMVCENGIASGQDRSVPEIHPLGAKDSAEMIELTALTKPGPFGSRTHELGTYLGIRQDGKLVAMAGERLKVPGYTEVSAVCTHPEHLGRGYAQVLMAEVMRRIRDRGETPFLHSRADNERAIRVYEKLGFRTRIRGHFAVLRKA